MVYNVQPKYRNTLRGTYAGDKYDTSGWKQGLRVRVRVRVKASLTLTLYGTYRGPNGRQRVISTH